MESYNASIYDIGFCVADSIHKKTSNASVNMQLASWLGQDRLVLDSRTIITCRYGRCNMIYSFGLDIVISPWFDFSWTYSMGEISYVAKANDHILVCDPNPECMQVRTSTQTVPLGTMMAAETIRVARANGVQVAEK